MIHEYIKWSLPRRVLLSLFTVINKTFSSKVAISITPSILKHLKVREEHLTVFCLNASFPFLRSAQHGHPRQLSYYLSIVRSYGQQNIIKKIVWSANFSSIWKAAVTVFSSFCPYTISSQNIFHYLPCLMLHYLNTIFLFVICILLYSIFKYCIILTYAPLLHINVLNTFNPFCNPTDAKIKATSSANNKDRPLTLPVIGACA